MTTSQKDVVARNGATTKTEETALAVKTETSGELAPTAESAAAQHEIQSAVILARRFPRDEEAARGRLLSACSRVSFAEEASYSFPRGEKTVTGPSVNLAREAARTWGNIRYGSVIVREGQASRQIRGFAWDLETNTYTEAEDEFAKLIYRKKTGWTTPDERDLRELTNRRAAILIRNCILPLIPKDLIESALETAKRTIRAGVKTNLPERIAKMTVAFSAIGVKEEEIARKLGHDLKSTSAEELEMLLGIYNSINDGNSRWSEYLPDDANGKEEGATGGSKTASLRDEMKRAREKKEAKSEEPGEEVVDEAPKLKGKETIAGSNGKTCRVAEGKLVNLVRGKTGKFTAVLDDKFGYSTFSEIVGEQLAEAINQTVRLAWYDSDDYGRVIDSIVAIG